MEETLLQYTVPPHVPPGASSYKGREHVLLHLPPQRAASRPTPGPSDRHTFPHCLEDVQRGPQVPRVPEAADEDVVVVGLQLDRNINRKGQKRSRGLLVPPAGMDMLCVCNKKKRSVFVVCCAD
ncbi:unnamed protein product [Ectocarpus sp. 6 AP-2014]